MGGGKLKAAVIDAGLLIHLAEIGCLRFLNVFEILCVPHAVWLETVGESRISQSNLYSVAANLEHASLVQSEVALFAEQNNLTPYSARSELSNLRIVPTAGGVNGTCAGF